MRIAPIPSCEDARLAALREYDFGGAPADPAFAHLVELAQRLFNVPTAFVSLVERDHQFFPAKIGLEVDCTARDISFCSHAIANDELLVVLDASLDARFWDNPLVTGDPRIRFYAGLPLRSPAGYPIGSLCLVDHKSRNSFSSLDRRNLEDIARLVLDVLETRRLECAKRISQSRFENIASTSPDAIICADQDGHITVWNPAAVALFGYDMSEVLQKSIDVIVPDSMRGGHGGGFARVVAGGAPRLIGKKVGLPARHKDGTEFQIELSLSMWNEGNQMAFGAIVRDVTDRRLNEDRLFHLAHHDALTGLPNRTVLTTRLQEAFAEGAKPTVIMVDLDGFKEVNDTMGHATGDKLLQLCAQRLQSTVKPRHTVARVGGDEFAILIPDVCSLYEAEEAAERLNSALMLPFQIDSEEFNLTCSCGIALASHLIQDPGELISAADLALYQAKAAGKHCFRSFRSELKLTALHKRQSREELHKATERAEFEIFYQPQVRLEDGTLTGAEALLRWNHPRQGLLTPASFMEALENSRYAAEVGKWVMGQACRQAAEWRKLGAPKFRIGVNLFAAQCKPSELPVQVLCALSQANLPASALELEITENVVLSQTAALSECFRQLKESGVGIALDDFGTGYASLSILKALPLTRLKIDQTFVKGLCDDPHDAAIVRAVLILSRSFDLEVIAEGVETAEQRQRLINKGCVDAQGYLFGKPIPALEFFQTYIASSATESAKRQSA